MLEMPGPKKGERFAGRQKGTPNRKTQERIMAVAREVEKSKAAGKKIGVVVLDECMNAAMSMAAYHQNRWAGLRDNPDPNQSELRDVSEGGFKSWLQMAGNFAIALAKHQTPTLKAVMVQQAPQPMEPRASSISNGGDKVIDDPASLTKMYQNKMRQVVPL